MGRNQNKDTNDLILELTAKTKKNFEDLNKIISEDQEISPSKSDTNRNRFRNNYSKEWYYKYKNDGNHNLI